MSLKEGIRVMPNPRCCIVLVPPHLELTWSGYHERLGDKYLAYADASARLYYSQMKMPFSFFRRSDLLCLSSKKQKGL